MTNVNKLLPRVLSKDGCNDFNPELIKESLLRETSLNECQADMITLESARLAVLIGRKIEKLTAPIIREIVEITMLQNGFELNRLEYTRIGISRHDIEELIKNTNYPHQEILLKVLKEFNEVIKLMEKIKNGEKK